MFVVATFVFLSNPNPEGNVWLSLAISIFFLGWLTPNLASVPTGGLTIQQEMGHYTLFALFRKKSAAFLAGTVIVGYLSAVLAQFLQQRVDPDSIFGIAINGWLRLQLFNTWPFFLLGGLGLALFRMWSKQGLTDLFPNKVKTPVLVTIALVSVGLSTYSQDTPGFSVLGYVIFGVLLALALNAIPIVGEMLRSIGRYSYFMYFFHFWVLRWIEDLYRGMDLPGDDQTSVTWNIATLLVIWIVATFVSWSVGWVSWRILEKPIVNAARKYVH